MGAPYLCELRIVSFNFPPKGWAFCNGQLLPINQNQALFSLLGTTYGGNGQTNFGLPNLQGRVPVHAGGGFVLGESAGEEAHTLTISELPTHVHQLQANLQPNPADSPNPSPNLFGQMATQQIYGGAANLTSLSSSTVTNVGASQAHANLQPFLVLNFCIALQGVFPSQN